MHPSAYRELLNRYFETANRIFVRMDGIREVLALKGKSQPVVAYAINIRD